MSTAFRHKIEGIFSELGPNEKLGQLGDFTMTPRVLLLSLIAIGVGAISACVALILLRLIGLFTNLFFFQRWSTALVSPAGNKLGVFEIIIPVIGALIVGILARYGSERIRGHGIPEAMEAILINGSKVEPKVAVLKPLSAAISIGSGGPFGAEGPIIVTGGALGSLIAQFIHLSSTERKTLLVAGAAAGMSATFATPLAAIFLAIEVLLFEWKPRSLIPVALASATAAVIRFYIIGPAPLFPVPPHIAFIGPIGFLGCVLAGLLVGLLVTLLTRTVYACEDTFHRLPIHWMWWPAIGGLVVGIGGFFFPQALGVGYDVIDRLLQGNTPLQFLLGILVVKAIIWSVSLGSGTSGGILAPLLMIGCALGGILAMFLPNEGAGFWSLICMGAVLGSTMRAPFTGIVFSLELTHDFNALLPLLIAVVIAYCFTVLVLRRSILTEKVSRRGYHISQEYATDPLEILFVHEVMRTNIVALPAQLSLYDVEQLFHENKISPIQHLFPVIDDGNRLAGIVTRSNLQRAMQERVPDTVTCSFIEDIQRQPVVAYPNESLRTIVYRMAESSFTRFPVVERDDPRKLVGIISLHDLLKARSRNLVEERQRERVLHIHKLFPTRTRVPQ